MLSQTILALSLSPEKLNDAFRREEFCQLFCKLAASPASTRITISHDSKAKSKVKSRPMSVDTTFGLL